MLLCLNSFMMYSYKLYAWSRLEPHVIIIEFLLKYQIRIVGFNLSDQSDRSIKAKAKDELLSSWPRLEQVPLA